MRALEPDDATRFAQTFESCYGRVHAYAARRVGSDAADDIAAEAFMVAWRRLDVMPTDPLPWLYGVARNLVLRHRSARTRQQATSQALAAEPVAQPVSSAEDPALWEAWGELSSSDQEVLALVAWEELPPREAAKALHCPTPVFSVRLHRARRRLERLLAQRGTSAKPIANLSEAS